MGEKKWTKIKTKIRKNLSFDLKNVSELFARCKVQDFFVEMFVCWFKTLDSRD